MCSKQARTPNILEYGINLTDGKDKAQAFNSLFASHSSKPSNDDLNERHILPRVSSTMTSFTINDEERKQVISKLNNRKANGPDNISNTILRNICHYYPIIDQTNEQITITEEISRRMEKSKQSAHPQEE
jgi:hypothetical protein